jgi:4-deoxy-L-threo-5-hexosulose-uronate ketol-isomerase
MNSAQLRENFLLQGLLQPGKLNLVYSHFDRMITGGAVPVKDHLSLGNYPQLRSDHFLERREMGIINVGGPGKVMAAGREYQVSKYDCLYLGRGTKDIEFRSDDAKQPAHYFFLSAPAHAEFPAAIMRNSEATAAAMGDAASSNERTIYRYIHMEGIRSCQLVMGLTMLKKGSVWNTMPAHTHNRRMEVYLYFDLAPEHRVFHLMGEPAETRHILVAGEEAVLSAPWSIHAGCGTSNYSFIWGMAGENQSFTDMDHLAIKDLI